MVSAEELADIRKRLVHVSDILDKLLDYDFDFVATSQASIFTKTMRKAIGELDNITREWDNG